MEILPVMESLSASEVVVSVPNDPTFLRVVRLVVASLAADLNYNYEEVEDLKIVADEIVHLAMTASAVHSVVTLIATLEPDGLRLLAHGQSDVHSTPDAVDPISMQLVGTLAAWVRQTETEGRYEVSAKCLAPNRADH
jgi:anti-sigma regulatory factor (Ser/Thr protein kinase)